MSYVLPAGRTEPTARPRTAYLLASGDLRAAANAASWPAQAPSRQWPILP